jgi:CRP-like cAMP-binding protein
MIGREGVIGVSALLGAAVSAQSLIIQIPGSGYRMSASRCKARFDQSAAFRAAVLRFAQAMLNMSAQTAACNRLHPVEQRCARWLLMAGDRIGSAPMPMTHEFLASMLGVRRAGVTTTAGDLQRSGLIRYHHGKLTITDREGLEAAACECYPIERDRLDGLL